MAKTNKYYILMADIANSRTQEGQALMAAFKELVKETNKEFKEVILSPLTITLGDEFQGVVKDLQNIILIIQHFEQIIIKYGFAFKLRYVVNYGTIDTPINPQIAHGMLGNGLTYGRELLEGLKNERGKRFKFHLLNNELLAHKLNLAFFNYQNFIDSWKLRDYPIIYEFINEVDYKEVAKKFEKDVSLMWRRKESLDIEEFLAMEELILLMVDLLPFPDSVTV